MASTGQAPADREYARRSLPAGSITGMVTAYRLPSQDPNQSEPGAVSVHGRDHDFPAPSCWDLVAH